MADYLIRSFVLAVAGGFVVLFGFEAGRTWRLSHQDCERCGLHLSCPSCNAADFVPSLQLEFRPQRPQPRPTPAEDVREGEWL